MLDFLQNDPLGFLHFMAYRAPAVLLALTIHELAHGYMALRCGDTTARDLGRLSLNPLMHLDVVGTIGMFLMGVGWAKPVPVNPSRFKNPRWDEVKVSLAGVITNFIQFLLATIFSVILLRYLFYPELMTGVDPTEFLGFQKNGFLLLLNPKNDVYLREFFRNPWLIHVQRFLMHLAMVNLGMGLFNLLPIPPLDGFHVLNQVFFAGRIQLTGKLFRITHMVLIAILLFTDFIGSFVGMAIDAVQGIVLPLILSIFHTFPR